MPTLMPTELATERLNLRLFEAPDTSWHRSLVEERGGGAISASADAAIVDRVSQQWTGVGFAPYVIIPQCTGQPIGYCGLVVGRSTVEEPELAFELFRQSHGHGYATEAAAAVVVAARASGLARLWSTVRTWNAPSFRVLDKLGFERDHLTEDDRGEIVWLRLELRAPEQ